MLNRLKHTTILFSIVASTLLLNPIAAQAQLEFTFAQPSQTTPAGSTVNFVATLTNTGGENIYFNGFNPGLTASGITITDTFLTNVPDTFAPGDSGTYSIFGIMVDPNAVAKDYLGLADIDYDTDTMTGLHATQGYSLTVVPTVAPETSTAVGMSLGLASLGVVALVRRKRMQSVSACSGCRN